ncbi:MAG: glycosyltransferase family 9 protein [Deltaproteobacteria bacterium]|nr:glycosyltransferase family 9 protein [Deltaproteobacteria bacterium]
MDIEMMPENHQIHRSKVLVLARGALGDVLMIWPFLAALPAHFGLEAISLIGQGPVLTLLKDQPFVAGIYNHDQADWAGLYLDTPQVSPQLKKIVLSHQIGVVLARRKDDPAAAGLRFLGLDPVVVAPSRPPEDHPQHLVDHLFQVTGIKPLPYPVLIQPPSTGVSAARDFVMENVPSQTPVIILHPGSSSPQKNWPLNRWLALAGMIEEDLKLKPLFLLGPADDYLAESLAKAPTGKPGSGLVMARNPTLRQAAGLISLSQAYIGHDSGLTHLAAGMGRPTLALFGPTNPCHWAPRGPKVAILQAKKYSLADSDLVWPQPVEVLSSLADILN